MSSASSPAALRSLHTEYLSRSAAQREAFDASPDGLGLCASRSALMDSIVKRLSAYFLDREPDTLEQLSIVAMGGYGRQMLLPHSDVDLLLLYDGRPSEPPFTEKFQRVVQELWDFGITMSPTFRTLDECGRLDRTNPEFTISLLDSRLISGDARLFATLHDKVIPDLVSREFQTLVQLLSDLTRKRHSKSGGTIFHLEPNIKESPGGLRDYNTACWLALMGSFSRRKEWPEADSPFPPQMRDPMRSALEFLLSLRAFLHYRHERDDNTLRWEDQDAAARLRIGAAGRAMVAPADWMRIYFHHARAIHRVANQLLDDIPPARSALYRQLQRWRSRVSNSDFSVVDGRVFLQQSTGAHSFDLLMRLFSFMGHHGLKLALDTELRVERESAAVTQPVRGPEIWKQFREILISPHAARALRAMNQLGVLKLVVPEFQLIDSLVIRDFYHRYTVDEHSLLTIETLHRLKAPEHDWERRYSGLLSELEKPELLFLALLLHDTGKGLPGENHCQASLELAEAAMARMELPAEDRAQVRFLIRSHLEMSSTLRRDIFDSMTIRGLAEKVGTPELLKMLCLLTYADVRSVNPEAMTPWKAENLWRLYIGTANYMSRSVDEDRFHAKFEADALGRIAILAPQRADDLQKFLEGMPHRYLRSHTPEQVLGHLEMALHLHRHPVELALTHARDIFELVLVTRDRPSLLATIAGVLAGWGMDITKADAFSNQSGTIVDIFHFRDPYRTLELNPSEHDRLKRSITLVLAGQTSLAEILAGRPGIRNNGTRAKVTVETKLAFDDASSGHSTLLEVIAQDRPGLLYHIASQLVEHDCNVEVALIDTEGEIAIDVFYLTSAGKKISPEHQHRIREALLTELKQTGPSQIA